MRPHRLHHRGSHLRPGVVDPAAHARLALRTDTQASPVDVVVHLNAALPFGTTVYSASRPPADPAVNRSRGRAGQLASSSRAGSPVTRHGVLAHSVGLVADAVVARPQFGSGHSTIPVARAPCPSRRRPRPPIRVPRPRWPSTPGKTPGKLPSILAVVPQVATPQSPHPTSTSLGRGSSISTSSTSKLDTAPPATLHGMSCPLLLFVPTTACLTALRPSCHPDGQAISGICSEQRPAPPPEAGRPGTCPTLCSVPTSAPLHVGAEPRSPRARAAVHRRRCGRGAGSSVRDGRRRARRAAWPAPGACRRSQRGHDLLVLRVATSAHPVPRP